LLNFRIFRIKPTFCSFLNSANSDSDNALGIAAKSPERSEDLQRKARPAGNAQNIFIHPPNHFNHIIGYCCYNYRQKLADRQK